MHVCRLEVQPKLAGDAVTEAVAGLRVQNHFRRTSRAASEIDDARFAAQGWFGIELCISLANPSVETRPAGSLAADDDATRNLEFFCFGGAVGIRHQRGDLGRFEPIPQIFGCEHRRARNWHNAQPRQAEHRDPPLRRTRGAMTRTRSPRRSPSCSKKLAARRNSRASWLKVIFCSMESCSRAHHNASASGRSLAQRSTTSRAKLKCVGRSSPMTKTSTSSQALPPSLRFRLFGSCRANPAVALRQGVLTPQRRLSTRSERPRSTQRDHRPGGAWRALQVGDAHAGRMRRMESVGII